MEKLTNFLNNQPHHGKPTASALAIVCLIIAVLMFMLVRKKKEEGKEVAMGALEGVLLVNLAASLVLWLVAFLA